MNLVKGYLDKALEPYEILKKKDYLAAQSDHGDDIRLVKGLDGHWTLVYAGESCGAHYIKNRSLEPFYQILLALYLKQGDVVIDVGANYGTVSFTFVHGVTSNPSVGPNGTVYAIEASPPIFDLLEKSIMLNNYQKVLKAYNCAITPKDEELYFEINKADSYGSSVSKDGKGYKVQGYTLDSFLSHIKEDRKIDLLRLDIEGFECQAMFSAKETIARSENIVVSFEWQYHLLKRYHSDEELWECLEFLPKMGFHMFAVDTTPYRPDTEVPKGTLRLLTQDDFKIIHKWDLIEILAARDVDRFLPYTNDDECAPPTQYTILPRSEKCPPLETE